MTLTVGSLFSGIGGLDLGLERAGMRVIWQSEINPYASRVLAHHWPEVPNLGDVTEIDWSTVERPDLICGGYPCQPFSLAGRRAGQDDARHLWPYFAEAIRILRPEWAFLENVRGHLSLGFKEVLEDLAALGFDAEWEVLPAAAFGAPHLRHRLIVVAYTGSARRRQDARGAFENETADEGRGTQDDHVATGNGEGGRAGYVADADASGRYGRAGVFGSARWGQSADRGSAMADGNGSTHWLVEPDVGRVAHGIPKRVDRLKCLGNAVVPQVAEWVGRRIVEVAA